MTATPPKASKLSRTIMLTICVFFLVNYLVRLPHWSLLRLFEIDLIDDPAIPQDPDYLTKIAWFEFSIINGLFIVLGGLIAVFILLRTCVYLVLRKEVYPLTLLKTVGVGLLFSFAGLVRISSLSGSSRAANSSYLDIQARCF